MFRMSGVKASCQGNAPALFKKNWTSTFTEENEHANAKLSAWVQEVVGACQGIAVRLLGCCGWLLGDCFSPGRSEKVHFSNL